MAPKIVFLFITLLLAHDVSNMTGKIIYFLLSLIPFVSLSHFLILPYYSPISLFFSPIFSPLLPSSRSIAFFYSIPLLFWPFSHIDFSFLIFSPYFVIPLHLVPCPRKNNLVVPVLPFLYPFIPSFPTPFIWPSYRLRSLHFLEIALVFP